MKAPFGWTDYQIRNTSHKINAGCLFYVFCICFVNAWIGKCDTTNRTHLFSPLRLYDKIFVPGLELFLESGGETRVWSSGWTTSLSSPQRTVIPYEAEIKSKEKYKKKYRGRGREEKAWKRRDVEEERKQEQIRRGRMASCASRRRDGERKRNMRDEDSAGSVVLLLWVSAGVESNGRFTGGLPVFCIWFAGCIL